MADIGCAPPPTQEANEPLAAGAAGGLDRNPAIRPSRPSPPTVQPKTAGVASGLAPVRCLYGGYETGVRAGRSLDRVSGNSPQIG